MFRLATTAMFTTIALLTVLSGPALGQAASDDVAVLVRALAELRQHPQAGAGATAMQDAERALQRLRNVRADTSMGENPTDIRDLALALIFLAGRQVELAEAPVARRLLEHAQGLLRASPEAVQDPSTASEPAPSKPSKPVKP